MTSERRLSQQEKWRTIDIFFKLLEALRQQWWNFFFSENLATAAISAGEMAYGRYLFIFFLRATGSEEAVVEFIF